MNDEKIEMLLEDLFQKLTSTHLEIVECPKDVLIRLLKEIIVAISVDYETYRKFIPKLLALLEKNDLTSLVVLVDSYMDYYESLVRIKPLNKIDEAVLAAKYTDDNVETFLKAFQNSMQYGMKIRVSESFLKSSLLNRGEQIAAISHLVDILQAHTEKLSWDDDTVQSVLMFLPVLRQLLNENGNKYSFYIITGMVMDRFGSSEFFQQARDLAEEINLSAYKDDVSYLGFFNSFRCYSNNSSAIPGLLYGVLSLSNAVRNSNSITENFVKEVIWQGIKFFRNISLFAWAQRIYTSIPKHIIFGDYEKRSITHSYFLSLLKMHDPALPGLILDYLSANREQMYASGIHDAVPWLITLYNVKRTYPNADFSAQGLGAYLNTLEMIVPPELIASQKAIIEGDVSKLKTMLKSSLVKLNETRSQSDVTDDNDAALIIAGRLVEGAIKKQDVEAIVLCAMTRADFSFIFNEKARQETAPVNIPKNDSSSFELIYGDPAQAIAKLKKLQDDAFLWVLIAEAQFYYVTLFREVFQFNTAQSWHQDKFTSQVTSGFFSTIAFDDTIKTKYEVREILPEEHEFASDAIKKNFDFITAEIPDGCRYLLVVFDIEFAGFPHNLLLNERREFIYLKNPICNIISNEWYLRNARNNEIPRAFSKAIWIPTEGGDFTINQLFSKLEPVLATNNFQVETSLDPKNPISSDLNIVCAHGANDISVKQVLYPDSNPRLSLHRYLGSGKVLILFVCHSGSTKQTPMKNAISTLVKEFIKTGYASVVAPFWSLHINIPPLWLPIFLSELGKKKEIAEAVHSANMEILAKYPTLSAWACMHAYGDPHLRVS